MDTLFHSRFMVPVCVVILLLAACSPAPIRIGYLSSETGPSGELGVAGRKAAEMAVETINAAGGIRGAPLILAPMDDKGQAEAALEGLKNLVAQDVNLVIGPLASSASSLVVPHANEKGILLLSPLVSAQVWEGKDDWFLRIIITNTSMGRQLAQHARGLGIGRAIGFFEPVNRLYSEHFTSEFGSALEAGGGEFVGMEALPSSDAEALSGAVAKVLEAKVDGVISILPGKDIALLVQKLHQAGWKGRVFSGPWGMDDNLRQLAGEAEDMVYLGSIYNNDPRSEAGKAFFRDYRSRYGVDPLMSAWYSWEAVMVMAEALRQSSDARPESVRKALAGHEFEGMDSAIPIDKYGDTERPMYFYTLKEARFNLED